MRVRDSLVTRLNVMCQDCCRLDVEARKVTFTTVWSFLASWPVQRTGVWCPGCRTRRGRRAALLSVIFGWWSIPGAVHTLKAIRRDLAGGELDPEENARVLAAIGSSLVSDGRVNEGRRALELSLGYQERPEVRVALDALNRGEDPNVYPDGWTDRRQGPAFISTDQLKG